MAPGGVGGRELVGEWAVVTEVGAGGADEDAVVDPVVDSHADAQLLTALRAQERLILDQHLQAPGRAAHLGGHRNFIHKHTDNSSVIELNLYRQPQ